MNKIKILRLSIAAGVLYWIIDSVIDAYIYHETSIPVQIFEPTPHEIYTRITTLGFFIFAVIAVFLAVKHKRSEKKLSESEKRYRTLAEASRDIIYIINREDRVEYVNSIGATLLGLIPEDIIGKQRGDLFSPDVSAQQKNDLLKVFETGNSLYLENMIPLPTMEVWLGTWLVPLKDDTGEIHSVMGVSREITERRKMEEALKSSEKRYRSLVENMPEVLYTLSTDGTITSLNPAFEKITGWSVSDWLGKQFMPLIHPEDLPRAIETFQKVLQGEKIPSYELRVLSKSGEYLTGEFTSAPQIENGKVASEFGIVRDITMRKRVEKALRESEEKFRTIFETANDAIFILDQKGNIIDTNRIAYERLGYSKEEMLSKNVSELDPPEFAAKVPERIEQLKKHGRAVFESAHIRKDGTIMPVEINARITDYAGGKALFSIIRDITERKRAEDMLKETTRTLQVLIDSSPLAIIAVDSGGNVILWNPAAERIFGWKDYEALGQPNPIIPVGKKEEFDFFRGRTMEGELLTNLELRRQRKDGSMVYINLSTAPIYDAKGSITGVMAVISDITERKKMEEQIYQVTHDWKDTFDTITDIITIHDKDFNIIRANKAAEKMLELPAPELEKIIKCYKYYHGTTCPPEGCPSCTCLKTGKPATFELFEPYLKMYVEIRAIPRFDSNNNLIGLIHVVRDITDKKKLEDQLRHAQKMEAVGTLTGGISHDFNNILTAIIGYGSILKMKLKDDDPLRGHADQILAAAERAANLTNSLLAFSRKQVINPTPVNINDIVKGVQKLLLRVIGEHIEMKTSLTDEDLPVMADSGQIEQVLINLCTNARDAMPDGGVLSIGTALAMLDDEYIRTYGYGKSGTYALISISDTGTGMDEKTRERIFEPFFTTKETGKGTGLGLSIVYGIIKQHNGYINCYSELGKGTTFKIYLSLTKAKVEETELMELITPVGGTETILLAEDDNEVRNLTKTVLEESGYKVIEAIDGEDAINKFMKNKDKIQLLLLDVIMPKISGKEVYHRMKKIRPDIKILFSSGYPADFIHRKEILDEGLNFISKPIPPRDILKRVREVLDK